MSDQLPLGRCVTLGKMPRPLCASVFPLKIGGLVGTRSRSLCAGET